MKTVWIITGGAILVILFIAIGWLRSKTPSEPSAAIPTPQPTGNALSLKSPAFSEGGSIPAVYTCDGANTRPALTISRVPAETKSFAIVMYDPDAPGGTFVHWVAWNIPPDTRDIPEGPLPAPIMEGTNSFQAVGYLGPCPPSGTHRYIWRLYALRTVLSLDNKASRKDLETAINTFVITQTELVGRYTKQ